MSIKTIKIHHIRMPLVAPFETSFGRATHRECLIIEVIGPDTYGIGECVSGDAPDYLPETALTSWIILRDYLAPLVLEKQAITPIDFQKSTNHVLGYQMAKAGLEMALWDIQGKRRGQSLRTLLGGTKEFIPVGVSVGLQPSLQALVETVGAYLENGYQRVKLKIKPGRDISEVAAVRSAFPDLLLQVDANASYVKADIPQLLPLDEFELLLIEQPFNTEDFIDHSILQGQMTTPVCLDESILSPHHAYQAIAMDACKVINIKPGRVGGILNSTRIHDLAKEQGVPVWCGGMLETGVGRVANLASASLSNFSLPGDISATDRYYEEDITNQRFFLNPDSTISVPTGPGLGVDLNRTALEKYTINSIPIE